MQPYGTATLVPLTIAWLNGNAGSLWLNRKALIGPRFHLKLKVNINGNSCTEAGTPVLDGWTIILSKTPNYLKGYGSALGYLDIYNALVVEFDFFQNNDLGDIGPNTVSIHKCYNQNCKSNEGVNTIQRAIPQAYDRCKIMNYEFNLVYLNGNLKVQLGDADLIETSENLDDKFLSWSFIGFSGSLDGRRREINILGSYMCEDDINLNALVPYFMVLITQVPTVEIVAGTGTIFGLSLIDASGLTIPHQFGEGVWKIDLIATTSCGAIAPFGPINRFHLTAAITNCTVAGIQTVTLKTSTKDVGKYPFTVTPQGFNKLTFAGFNGVPKTEAECIQKNTAGLTVFKCGSLPGGEFSFDEFGGFLKVDFYAMDIFNNKNDIGKEPDQILMQMGITVTSDKGTPILQVQALGDAKYSIMVPIKWSGGYKLTSAKFTTKDGYSFFVFPGVPSSNKSTCNLVGYTSTPTIDAGVSISLKCIIYDKGGNSCDCTQLAKQYSLELGCKAKRLSPLQEDLATETLSTVDSFTCTYTSTKNGSFNFAPYWKIPSSPTSNAIPVTLSNFIVQPIPKDITNVKIFNYLSNKFGAPNEAFTYVKTAASLTAIDMLDIDGTSFSVINYSQIFSLANISGRVFNSHDVTVHPGVPKFEYIMINNAKYIGVFLDKSDQIITKSSHQYQLELKYLEKTLLVPFLFPMGNTNGKIACVHNLALAKTFWGPTNAQGMTVTANSEVNLGQIILQTTDGFLYPYRIDKKEFILEVKGINDKTQVYVAEDETADGFYNLKFRSTLASTYQVAVKLASTGTYLVPLGSLSTSINVVPSPYIAIFDAGNLNAYDTTKVLPAGQYYLAKRYTADENPQIFFKAKDEFGNILSYDPNEQNAFLQVKLFLSIGGVEYGVSKTLNFEYSAATKSYVLTDILKLCGNYKIIVTSQKTDQFISFMYTKISGKLNVQKSQITMVNTPDLKIFSPSTIYVLLRDNYFINLTCGGTNIYYPLFSQIQVTASSDTKEVVTYSFISVENSMGKYIAKMDKQGLYTVTAKYVDGTTSEMLPSKGLQFLVSYDTFEIKNSKMVALLSKMVQMSENSILQIDNQKDKPLFNFYFYDSLNNMVQFVDPKSILKATVTGNNINVTLDKEWISYNTLLWTFPTTTNIQNIKGANYALNVYFMDLLVPAKVYTLQMLGDGQDADAGNGTYDPNLTFFSETDIKTTAGVNYNFNLQFRTKENLRWNDPGDPLLFKFTNSLAIVDDKQFKCTAQRGAKKGEFIITVFTTKATTAALPNILTIIYESNVLKQKVNINTKHADIAKIVIDPTSRKDMTSTQLKSGTSIDIPEIIMQPFDKYNNLFLDLFDLNIFSLDRIARLVSFTHSKQAQVSATATTSAPKSQFYLKVISRTTGVVSLSSLFLNNGLDIYTIDIAPGPMKAKYSYGVIANTDAMITAGQKAIFRLFPKDEYDNAIQNLLQGDMSLVKIQMNQVPLVIEAPTSIFEGKAFELAKVLTKAVDVVFTGVINNEIVKNSNGALKVNMGPVNFLKKSILMNGMDILTSTLNYKLDKSSSPNFLLRLFDDYGNQYQTISSYTLTATFSGNESTVKFCVENSNNMKAVFVCRDTENKNSWFYIVSKTNYKLTLTNGANESLVFPIDIVGGTGDSDASNGAVDYSKTFFSTTKLLTTAGVSTQFLIELRTTEGLRKNYWYDKPSEKILLSFSKGISSYFTTSVITAEKPGQYYIKVTSTKTFTEKDDNQITVKVEGTALPLQVRLEVRPNIPVQGYFIDTTQTKIENGKFPNANADKQYDLTLLILDTYGNTADMSTTDVSFLIVPPSTKSEAQIDSTLVKNANQTFKLTILPIYAGKYTISSKFWNATPFSFISEPGKPFSANSIASTVSQATAGDDVKISVVPFDQNNNYIDPKIYLTGANPFSVYLKYKVNGVYSKYNLISTFVLGEYVIGPTTYNAYIYTQKLIYRYQNYFRVTLGAVNEIKCINCVTDVAPAPMKFLNSYLMRFDPVIGKFVEMGENVNEDNVKADVIYRIYPRDQYGNFIDTVANLSKYSATLTGKENVPYTLYMSSKDDNAQYVEFTKLDDPALKTDPNINKEISYNTLTGGYYTAKFTYITEVLTKTITLAGRPEDAFASNQEVDFQNTNINEAKLSFTAGDTGYIIFELRTKNNLRKNFWGTYQFKLVPSIKDPSFEFKQRVAGTLGCFYVTVKSTLANTFPVKSAYSITVMIDNVVVQKLTPSLEISPGDMSKAVVLPEYLKAATSLELKDGNADVWPSFKIQANDVYGNPTICDPGTLQLAVYGPDNLSVQITPGRDVLTGYASYLFENKIAGTYSISAGANYKDEAYFANKYTFTNKYGALNADATLIAVIDSKITAGDNATFSVTPRDQNKNNIPPDTVISNISISVQTPSMANIAAIPSVVNEKIIFTAKLTERTSNYWNVKIAGKSVICDSCITEVKSAAAYPNNSIIYSLNNVGTLTKYPNKGLINCSIKNPLTVYVSLADKFGNPIDPVTSDVDIINSVLSGNDMTPISLSSTVNEDKSKYVVTIPESSVYAYSHLVSAQNYQMQLTVQRTVANSTPEVFKFEYTIGLQTDRDDSGYGNGKYVVELTSLSHSAVVLSAGSAMTINLRLKTAKGLYYNDDISPSDIQYSLNPQDKEFKFTPYKRGLNYGDYNLDLYTINAKLDIVYELTILIKDPDNPSLMKPLPNKIKITTKPQIPPDSQWTKITSQPKDTLPAGSSLTIAFKLFDTWENPYFRNNEIVNAYRLLVTNNGSIVPNPITKLYPDGLTYEVSFMPAYPPHQCVVNIMYKDEKQVTNILKDPIKTTIVAEPHWPNTIITGKNVIEMKAGQKVDIQVSLYDINNICVDTVYPTGNVPISATVTGPLEVTDESKKFNASYSFVAQVNEYATTCKTFYYANVLPEQIYSTVGTYRITVKGGPGLQDLKVFNQKVVPEALDPKMFVSKYTMEGAFNPGMITSGTTVSFSIQGRDKYGNKISRNILDLVKLKLKSKDGALLNQDEKNPDYKIQLYESTPGIISGAFMIIRAGGYNMQYFFSNEEITNDVDFSRGPFEITVIPDVCSNKNPIIDYSALSKAVTGEPTYFTITCRDQFNNLVNTGNANFIVFISVFITATQTSSEVKSKIIDKQDGTYRIEFTPPLTGKYSIVVSLGTQNYGESKTIDIVGTQCPPDKPNKCPNSDKCVVLLIDCIPPNQCPKDAPFYCKVNGKDTCVKSQVFCDCPSGTIKCDYMNTCVPQDKDYMCSFSIPINCNQFLGFNYLCDDGICRISKDWCPAQRVCPIGFVLCPDLSCRDTLSNCALYEDCPSATIRCPDQSCVKDQKDCPSTITCPKINMMVCPDGACVASEVDCKSLPKCMAPNSILCPNNSCVSDIRNCPKSIVCGHGYALCRDLICRRTCAE